jgi:hypothetical protein
MKLCVAWFFLYHDIDHCLPARVDVSMLHSIIDELDLGSNHLFPFVFHGLPCESVQGEGVFTDQGLVMTEMQSRGRGGCLLVPGREV